MSDATRAAHGHAHDDEEIAPEITVPQGIQFEGIPPGWEERDINIGAFFRWMAGLFVSTALTFAIVWGAFQLLMKREADRDIVPSEIVARKQVPPPPRLLPNRIDYPLGESQYVPDPPEIGQWERAAQNEAMAKRGLFDRETGLPIVPDNVAQRVIAAEGGSAGAPGGPVQTVMPSDASGGLINEDWSSQGSGAGRRESGVGGQGPGVGGHGAAAGGHGSGAGEAGH